MRSSCSDRKINYDACTSVSGSILLLFVKFLHIEVITNKQQTPWRVRYRTVQRATAACRQSQWQLLPIEGCRVVSAADPLQS
jgi:hypothetical protein